MANEAKSKKGEFKDGCMITGTFGRPQINRKGNVINTARKLLGLEKGDPRMALHKCNNDKCLNASHLYIGNAQDNANDVVRAKKFCKNGHDLDLNSQIVRRKGRGNSHVLYRRCKLCERMYKIRNASRNQSGRIERE